MLYIGLHECQNCDETFFTNDPDADLCPECEEAVDAILDAKDDFPIALEYNDGIEADLDGMERL